MKQLRIVIADDHPIFREGLKKVIERDPQLQVVGEAENGEIAIARIAEMRPDVAVLDAICLSKTVWPCCRRFVRQG